MNTPLDVSAIEKEVMAWIEGKNGRALWEILKGRSRQEKADILERLRKLNQKPSVPKVWSDIDNI